MDPIESTQPQTPEDRDAQIKRDIIAGLQAGGMQVRPAPAFDFEEERPDIAAHADPSLLTGKDVFEYMQANRKARFSNDEMGRKSYRMMMEYMDARKTDFIGAAENAVGMMIEELGGLADAPLNPAKFGASVAEGAAKGVADMYGIFAQSEDPGSWGFKLKSYLMRLAGKDDGDIDSQIRQFHEARDFNNRSYEHMEGKGTILGDYMPEGWKKTYEGLVDAKFATALSYAVLDIPEWFFSAGTSTPATALKLAATGAAKSAKATWAARAVERLGGFGTNLIGKGVDVAAGKTLEAAGTIIRAPFKAIYGASAAATQLAGDYAGNAVRNASTAAAVEMGAEMVGSGLRHPAMGFMRSIGLEALGELAQTAGADIVDRALGKAMVKPDAIGMTTLERLASGTARGADLMSREAQMLAVGVNATVGWATSMSSSALKAMFRDGIIGAGIGYYNSREEGAGAGVGMGVAWGGLSGTVRHMGAYTRFQHQDQLVVDNFKQYGIEAFRRVLGPTGYESAKRFAEHVEGYGDLRTTAIEMAHLQTLIAHEGALMGVGNVNFYFGDAAKNPSELMQILVDMKAPADRIQSILADVPKSAGMMADFKDVNGADKKILIFNRENYRPTTGRHEVAHLLLRSVAEANGDMELISDGKNRFKIFRPNYLLNLLGSSKDMGAMPDKAWNSMIQSYHALMAHSSGMDEASARAYGAQYANAVEVFRDLYSKGQLVLQDPNVARIVADISRVAEEAFAYYQGGLSNVLPIDQYAKDPAARNMLRAWAENRAARKNSLIMADLEMAGVEIKARLTNPDGSPKIYSDQVDQHGNPIPVFDAFLFDDGKMLRTPGMDSWIDMVMRQAYSKGEVLTSTMDPIRQEALAKSSGKTHLFNTVAGGGMRLKSPKELDEISTQQAQTILGAAGSVPEDVRPFVEVDQEGATKIKLESISSDALEAIKKSGAFTKQEWDGIVGMINIVQRNRQGAMHHNVLNATLLAHTMQVRKGASVIRLTGKDVPVTYRSFVPLSVEVYVKTHDAQGNPLRNPKGGVLIHSLDVAAENRRLQKIFKRADVQQLFGGDFEKFVHLFNSYVINQSGLNGARVPTAELFKPLFGDEAGRVRDIMYEAFGGRKTKDATWINEPANGYRGGADDPNRPFFTMRYDTMADIQVQPTAWNPYSRVPFFPYIHNIAYEGVTKNFQLTGFAASPLANGGMMFRNRQGFEIFESKKGYALFDPFGIKVGVFKTAAKAMKKAAKDVGEIDEADTIPDNAVFDTNPHAEQANEVEDLTSTFMRSGRYDALHGRLRGGRSEIGLTPAEYIAAIGRTGPESRFTMHETALYGYFPMPELGMPDMAEVTFTGKDGKTYTTKFQPKTAIRLGEAFGAGKTLVDDMDFPAEEAVIVANKGTQSMEIDGGLFNAPLTFSPAYARGLISSFGPDFANDVLASRAAASLIVATSVRNGSIALPASGGPEASRHAMRMAALMADRSLEAKGKVGGTNSHEVIVDNFTKTEQIGSLQSLSRSVRKAQAWSPIDKRGTELRKATISSANPAFVASALSIRATFGTLDWAKRIVKQYERGAKMDSIRLEAARAILSTVYGELGSPIPAENLDFLAAYQTAQRVYGTEQNEHALGGGLAAEWRFRSPDNPDRVLMFQDAMIDMSGLASIGEAKNYEGLKKIAPVIRDIESHHAKFLAQAKEASIKDPSTIGPWDPYSVRTTWVSNLDDLMQGLSYAVTERIVGSDTSAPSKRAQMFLDAWADSAERVSQNGGVYSKTAIGEFDSDGMAKKTIAGTKAAFAWMEMDNVDDPDVDNVLTHKSIYDGIQDAIDRFKGGDQSAIGDAAALYGVIASLTTAENPFFHLIKPTYERDLDIPSRDSFNRSTFNSKKNNTGPRGGIGSTPGVGAYVRKPASIYDLPASRSYITKRPSGKLPDYAQPATIYVQSSLNSASPDRYRAAAKSNAVIGSKVSPVIVSSRAYGDIKPNPRINFVVDNGESISHASFGGGEAGKLTMPPDAVGADNLRTKGTAFDTSGATYSPSHLAIAMKAMRADGSFDFSKQVARSKKDMGVWFEANSSFGSASYKLIDTATSNLRQALSMAGSDPEKVGLANAALTKFLVDSGISHAQAMFAEKIIKANMALEDAAMKGDASSPAVLSALSSLSDAIVQSKEVMDAGAQIEGIPAEKIKNFAELRNAYQKEGTVILGSKRVPKGETIESTDVMMLVGRKAEAYLSKERRDILASLGLIGKLRDAAGKEHIYFEISDARASLNTSTFSNGLSGALTNGLPDAVAAIEGAVLARMGRGHRVDLDSLVNNFNSRNLKLRHILIHDELFALYPQLANMEVSCIHGMGCAFDPTGSGSLKIGVDNFLRQEYAAAIDIPGQSPRAGEALGHEGRGGFPDYHTNFKDVVLHEVQHAIQTAEDWRDVAFSAPVGREATGPGPNGPRFIEANNPYGYLTPLYVGASRALGSEEDIGIMAPFADDGTMTSDVVRMLKRHFYEHEKLANITARDAGAAGIRESIGYASSEDVMRAVRSIVEAPISKVLVADEIPAMVRITERIDTIIDLMELALSKRSSEFSEDGIASMLSKLRINRDAARKIKSSAMMALERVKQGSDPLVEASNLSSVAQTFMPHMSIVDPSLSVLARDVFGGIDYIEHMQEVTDIPLRRSLSKLAFAAGNNASSLSPHQTNLRIAEVVHGLMKSLYMQDPMEVMARETEMRATKSLEELAQLPRKSFEEIVKLPAALRAGLFIKEMALFDMGSGMNPGMFSDFKNDNLLMIGGSKGSSKLSSEIVTKDSRIFELGLRYMARASLLTHNIKPEYILNKVNQLAYESRGWKIDENGKAVYVISEGTMSLRPGIFKADVTTGLQDLLGSTIGTPRKDNRGSDIQQRFDAGYREQTQQNRSRVLGQVSGMDRTDAVTTPRLDELRSMSAGIAKVGDASYINDAVSYSDNGVMFAAGLSKDGVSITIEDLAAAIGAAVEIETQMTMGSPALDAIMSNNFPEFIRSDDLVEALKASGVDEEGITASKAAQIAKAFAGRRIHKAEIADMMALMHEVPVSDSVGAVTNRQMVRGAMAMSDSEISQKVRAAYFENSDMGESIRLTIHRMLNSDAGLSGDDAMRNIFDTMTKHTYGEGVLRLQTVVTTAIKEHWGIIEGIRALTGSKKLSEQLFARLQDRRPNLSEIFPDRHGRHVLFAKETGMYQGPVNTDTIAIEAKNRFKNRVFRHLMAVTSLVERVAKLAIESNDTTRGAELLEHIYGSVIDEAIKDLGRMAMSAEDSDSAGSRASRALGAVGNEADIGVRTYGLGHKEYSIMGKTMQRTMGGSASSRMSGIVPFFGIFGGAAHLMQETARIDSTYLGMAGIGLQGNSQFLPDSGRLVNVISNQTEGETLFRRVVDERTDGLAIASENADLADYGDMAAAHMLNQAFGEVGSLDKSGNRTKVDAELMTSSLRAHRRLKELSTGILNAINTQANYMGLGSTLVPDKLFSRYSEVDLSDSTRGLIRSAVANDHVGLELTQAHIEDQRSKAKALMELMSEIEEGEGVIQSFGTLLTESVIPEYDNPSDLVNFRLMPHVTTLRSYIPKVGDRRLVITSAHEALISTATDRDVSILTGLDTTSSASPAFASGKYAAMDYNVSANLFGDRPGEPIGTQLGALSPILVRIGQRFPQLGFEDIIERVFRRVGGEQFGSYKHSKSTRSTVHLAGGGYGLFYAAENMATNSDPKIRALGEALRGFDPEGSETYRHDLARAILVGTMIPMLSRLADAESLYEAKGPILDLVRQYAKDGADGSRRDMKEYIAEASSLFSGSSGIGIRRLAQYLAVKFSDNDWQSMGRAAGAYMFDKNITPSLARKFTKDEIDLIRKNYMSSLASSKGDTEAYRSHHFNKAHNEGPTHKVSRLFYSGSYPTTLPAAKEAYASLNLIQGLINDILGVSDYGTGTEMFMTTLFELADYEGVLHKPSVTITDDGFKITHSAYSQTPDISSRSLPYPGLVADEIYADTSSGFQPATGATIYGPGSMFTTGEVISPTTGGIAAALMMFPESKEYMSGVRSRGAESKTTFNPGKNNRLTKDLVRTHIRKSISKRLAAAGTQTIEIQPASMSLTYRAPSAALLIGMRGAGSVREAVSDWHGAGIRSIDRVIQYKTGPSHSGAYIAGGGSISLVNKYTGNLTGFAESKPSRGFSWSRAANGDILVNISGDHLGYKMDGRAFDNNVGFGFSLVEGVGYDPNRRVLIPGKAQAQAGIHQIMSSYGHFMVDAFDPNAPGMASAYEKADAAMQGLVHRSRLDAVTPKDLKETTTSVATALRDLGQYGMPAHISAAQKLSFGQPASYVTIRIPANANMETIKQMLLTAHMDPTITPNYGIVGRAGRFEGAMVRTMEGKIFGNYGDQQGSYHRSLKHKIRTTGNGVLDSATPADVLMQELSKSRQAVDPHVVDDIELLVARIIGGESGYFLPDAERKLALDGDTGMAVATLFPGRDDLLKYSWDAKALHGIKIWKRTAPKGDVNFKAHVVQFDAPISVTPEGGLQISKTAVAFKTAAEAEQYANRVSRMMSGAEMVKALADGELEVVDRPDLSKADDPFIGDLKPQRASVIGETGLVQSANGYTVGDLDMMFDRATATKVSRALDTRKHIRFKAGDTLLMASGRKMDELEALVKSKLNFGLPRGPIAFASKAMNAIAKGVDHHKRYKETMTGADWFAFMKTNGVSGEELRQSGLGQLFYGSMDTPLTRMDVAEFFAAMMPNLVKNDFRFSPHQRGVEAMTLGIPQNEGSNLPAFVSSSGWHLPYVTNAAIQTVANMKMSIDAVRGPLAELEMRMSEANARGDVDATVKLTAAIDSIRQSATAAAERMGMDAGTLEGASVSQILQVLDEKLKSRVGELGGNTSTSNELARLAQSLDFGDIEKVRQKYNDEVGKMLKDQAMAASLAGLAPEIYAPLRLMRHGWIGATKPELGLIAAQTSSSNSGRSSTFSFGSDYTLRTGQALGFRSEGWDGYSTGRQQIGTQTAVQFYDAAKQDEINQYIENLESDAATALNAGDNERHKAVTSLIAAARRVSTVRKAMATLHASIGSHFGDYLPTRDVSPKGGEYEIGHYRYSLNLSLAGLSLPIFDRPDALLIGTEAAGLPAQVRLEKLGFPVMMMEEFQSDLFQKFAGTGLVEEVDAFLPSSAEEAAKMALAPEVKKLEEQVAAMTAIKDNATKHLLENLIRVVSDKSFSDMTLRLQLNNLDMMNKMFVAASSPGFFRGTGRFVNTPESLRQSINRQAGFMLPERMPVIEPDIELIKLVMMSNNGGTIPKAVMNMVSQRMLQNVNSAMDIHALFSGRGMNVNQIVEGIRQQPLRSLQNSWSSIQQLLHKANTDMMSENYLSRIIPSLESAPDGDLKEMLKSLHSYIETIGQRGADSQGLLAAQLAAVLLLDEKFVLEVSQSAQNGSRVDFEGAARRALENVRARFADTKSFNGKTIMTSLEVMLQSASEPKPHMHAANNFANGTDLGAQTLMNGILFMRDLAPEQLSNLENVPLNELIPMLGLRPNEVQSQLADIAWQIDAAGDLTNKAIYIERGPSLTDNGPQRSYIALRTEGNTGTQMANRIMLEALKAKREGRALGGVILADYDRYSGTQAGGFARAVGELVRGMVNKEELGPEIERLKAEIAVKSKGIPEMGEFSGSRKGSDAIMPNALPFVDINGYKSAHLSMAVIDSMNHGMRAIGMYDSTFQLERGHGLSENPSLYIGMGKNNRFVFRALGDDLEWRGVQAVMYAYSKLISDDMAAPDGPHGGFLHRLHNMDDVDVQRILAGQPIDHQGNVGTLGWHMSNVFWDMHRKLPDGVKQSLTKAAYGIGGNADMFVVGSSYLTNLTRKIDAMVKQQRSHALKEPAYVGGKKAPNAMWQETSFKFNANSVKDSPITMMPQQAHGSAGWGYVTNYGMPGWKLDMMAVGATKTFKNLYSLDAFERPKFEVRGSNMVLLDPKTGRELVTVDVTTEKGMRIFREKYLQASKYRGGNWAINAFMKEWGASGGYIDMTTLADLPGYSDAVSGYMLNITPGVTQEMSAFSNLTQTGDPMGDAIMAATKQGKLSPEGFAITAPFVQRINASERASILSPMGADFGDNTAIPDDPSGRGSMINAFGQLAGGLAGAELKADRPRAMPTASSFSRFGMVHPTVYAAVIGGSGQTPESIAHTILRIRNPIVATMVHTPEMRTKEHEMAFRTKISSGVNLLMASGRRVDQGKPVSPEVISALAQLADKVQASGEHASRRRTERVGDGRYRDLRDNVPITYADNLMVDRSKLPELPMAENPAAIDPSDRRARIYDRELAVDLMKAGHSDLEISRHLGLSRMAIILLRAKEGIAPLPEGAGSKRVNIAVNKLTEQELTKRMDKLAEGLAAGEGTFSELMRSTHLTDSKRQHGGWKKVREYVEKKGIPTKTPRKKRSGGKVDPSPSDSLSDKTHEAQVRETPSDQSKLMKREILEGDMNG